MKATAFDFEQEFLDSFHTNKSNMGSLLGRIIPAKSTWPMVEHRCIEGAFKCGKDTTMYTNPFCPACLRNRKSIVVVDGYAIAVGREGVPVYKKGDSLGTLHGEVLTLAELQARYDPFCMDPGHSFYHPYWHPLVFPVGEAEKGKLYLDCTVYRSYLCLSTSDELGPHCNLELDPTNGDVYARYNIYTGATLCLYNNGGSISSGEKAIHLPINVNCKLPANHAAPDTGQLIYPRLTLNPFYPIGGWRKDRGLLEVKDPISSSPLYQASFQLAVSKENNLYNVFKATRLRDKCSPIIDGSVLNKEVPQQSVIINKPLINFYF